MVYGRNTHSTVHDLVADVCGHCTSCLPALNSHFLTSMHPSPWDQDQIFARPKPGGAKSMTENDMPEVVLCDADSSEELPICLVEAV
jgi:hypothetical protein